MRVRVLHLNGTRTNLRLNISVSETVKTLLEAAEANGINLGREPTLSLNGKTPLSHRETTFLNSLGICSGDLVYVLPFPDFQSENAKPPQEQRSRLQQYNGRPQFSPTSDADPKKKRVHTKPTQPRCRQCSGSGHTQIFLAELREELAAIDRDVGQRKRCLIAASLALQLLSLDYGFRILSETDFQHHLKKNTAKTDGRNTLDRDCTESMDGKEDVDVTDLIYASIQAQQGECVTLFFLWQLEDNPAYVVRVSVALMIDGFAMTVSIYNITSIDRRRPSCFASSTRVLELADLIWPQNPHTFWRVEKFIENFAGQTPFARFALDNIFMPVAINCSSKPLVASLQGMPPELINTIEKYLPFSSKQRLQAAFKPSDLFF